MFSQKTLTAAWPVMGALCERCFGILLLSPHLEPDLRVARLFGPGINGTFDAGKKLDFLAKSQRAEQHSFAAIYSLA